MFVVYLPPGSEIGSVSKYVSGKPRNPDPVPKHWFLELSSGETIYVVAFKVYRLKIYL